MGGLGRKGENMDRGRWMRTSTVHEMYVMVWRDGGMGGVEDGNGEEARCYSTPGHKPDT